MNVIFIIVIFSILIQVASVVLALKLVPLTGRKVAWSLIALAITGMALRRIESLVSLLGGEVATPSDMLFETVGLATSLLMFCGVLLIRPVFASVVRSKEELGGMNKRLTALSQEQQLLLDHTRDFIYRHDPSGMITYVSPAVERITGYRPEEWLVHYTHHYTDNPVNEQGKKMTDDMLRTGKGGQPYRVEVKHRTGTPVWLEISKEPYLADNRIAGVIGVARDITARVQLEQEREKLIAELQDALANIKALRGMLPICSSCKKIRDDKGYWNQIEAYISEHSEAEFTHALCPDCAQKLYPGYSSRLPSSAKK